MSTLGSVLLAVFFPILWGLLSSWAFDRWRERRGRSLPDQESGSRGKTE